MVHPGYRKRTIVLLIGLLLIRFWFAQTFELSGQEAYLWLQGHGTNLGPAYWERGPFVPLLTRIGTTFFGDTELGVRWLAAVIACLSGFILFYLARHWFNARAAFWTVVLFVIVPMYAWKLSFMTEATASIGLMALAMFAFCRAVEEDKIWWWALGGCACGMGLLVAFANISWLMGILLYFGLHPARRHRLQEIRPWAMVVFALLFLFPIAWWWWGAQVADVRHARLVNAWPLSHSLSINRGFKFLWLEIFYLSPPFFLLLGFLLYRLGRQLWDDPRYSLLVSLALPGLVWQLFSAFFQEGRFELVPALFLPLILLVGCYTARVTNIDHAARWVFVLVYTLAGVQSLAGLNPYYLFVKSDGQGYQVLRTQSGESVTGFDENKRQISWRNLADQIERMQRDEGATLLITDTPATAAALSFYLPRNPSVYVVSKPEVITHFDFWPQYDETASPNDSALYITRTEDPPPSDITRDFTTVTPLKDPPLQDFDKAWNIWSCQNFRGSSQPAGSAASTPMHDSDALPK